MTNPPGSGGRTHSFGLAVTRHPARFAGNETEANSNTTYSRLRGEIAIDVPGRHNTTIELVTLTVQERTPAASGDLTAGRMTQVYKSDELLHRLAPDDPAGREFPLHPAQQRA